jgi:hypothetical protein
VIVSLPVPGVVPWFVAGLVIGGVLAVGFGAPALALIGGGLLLAIGARHALRRRLRLGGGRNDRH